MKRLRSLKAGTRWVVAIAACAAQFCLTYGAGAVCPLPSSADTLGIPSPATFQPVLNNGHNGSTYGGSYFKVTIDPNGAYPGGSYLGWCADAQAQIDPSLHYTGTIIDSQFLSCPNAEHGSCVPAVVYQPDPGFTPSACVWNELNYLINHKIGNADSIQAAIWALISPASASDLASIGSYNTADVNAMVTAAQANSNFVPGPGQLRAAVVYVSDSVQLIFIETTIPGCTGEIGDYVWQDLNGNGCQDAGEPGIPNVEVDLYSGSCGGPRTLVATTHTDATGHYLFSGLCMGDYQVSIVTPSGMIATVPRVGCVNNSLPPDRNQLDSKCGCTGGAACFVCVTLSSANPVNHNVDCGYVPPPSPNCVTIVAVQGVPINPATMTGSGGCGGPYTFTAVGLPTGLTMSSSGTISGTPTVTGTFSYVVTVTDKCGNQGSINCSVTVSPQTPPPVGHGDTATIGFWHNKNGQALIKALNGGPTSTALGTWLATTYGCLFGNLNGQPNTVVAAQFLTYFNVTGTKTYAQVMAGALADYATSSTLAGGNVAAGYGFNVSPTGTGAKTYNVGLNGAAIGLANNTSYTVAQLLTAANVYCSNGAILPGAFIALNNIFDGINSSGDIQ